MPEVTNTHLFKRVRAMRKKLEDASRRGKVEAHVSLKDLLILVELGEMVERLDSSSRRKSHSGAAP